MESNYNIVKTAIEGVVTQITAGFNSELNKLSDLWDSITGGFTSTGNKLGDLWDNITINGNKISDVWESVKNIPNDIGNKIQEIFVPSENYLGNKLSDFKTRLIEKYPIINQFLTLFNSLFNQDYNNGVAPTFTIHAYGQDMNIIDFNMFISYREYVHAIIVVIMYTFWGLRTMKKLPSIIRGF